LKAISRIRSLSQWHLGALGHAEPVARVVAESRLDAIEALGWLRQEADAALAEVCVCGSTVVGLERPCSARALGDERLHLLSSLLVHHWRPWNEQDELVVRPAGRIYGQPAEVVHRGVGIHLEAELLCVERERLVLVEHPNRSV